MSGGVIEIGNVELLGSALLMVVAAVVSWKLSLGQEKSIVVATGRAFLQLLAMGFVLVYLFKYESWWLVGLVLLAMTAAAVQIAVGRVKQKVPRLSLDVFATLLVSSLTVSLLVVELVIQPDPWYSARQLVPITGMMLGNTMAATALAIDRLFADMDSRAEEMFSLVCLGATPYEAAFPSIKAAVGAGITPTLATMSAAGIVQIPGMMSGQILAGADPVLAAKYQIVILLMLSACTTIAIVVICLLTYRKRFSPEGYYLERGLR